MNVFRNNFFKKHNLNALRDAYQKAELFYFTQFGVINTLPKNLLFDVNLLNTSCEKLIVLLKLLEIDISEVTLHWVAKLYFCLPLPKDWSKTLNSFESEIFICSLIMTPFHPSIGYILKLVEHFRITKKEGILKFTHEENLNSVHFTKNIQLNKICNKSPIKKQLKSDLHQSTDRPNKISTVVIFEEYRSFLTKPQLNNSSLLSILTKCNEKNILERKKKTYSKINIDKKERFIKKNFFDFKPFKIRRNLNNFFQISDESQNEFKFQNQHQFKGFRKENGIIGQVSEQKVVFCLDRENDQKKINQKQSEIVKKGTDDSISFNIKSLLVKKGDKEIEKQKTQRVRHGHENKRIESCIFTNGEIESLHKRLVLNKIDANAKIVYEGTGDFRIKRSQSSLCFSKINQNGGRLISMNKKLKI